MKRFSLFLCTSAAAGLLLGATLVHAQTRQAQLEHPKLEAKACADRERLALADIHQWQSRETDGANPSERLARTDGVICPPPDIDPDIRARPPGGGRIPVILPSAIEPGTQAK